MGQNKACIAYDAMIYGVKMPAVSIARTDLSLDKVVLRLGAD